VGNKRLKHHTFRTLGHPSTRRRAADSSTQDAAVQEAQWAAVHASVALQLNHPLGRGGLSMGLCLTLKTRTSSSSPSTSAETRSTSDFTCKPPRVKQTSSSAAKHCLSGPSVVITG